MEVTLSRHSRLPSIIHHGDSSSPYPKLLSFRHLSGDNFPLTFIGDDKMKSIEQMKKEVKAWGSIPENRKAILAVRARIKEINHPKPDLSRYALMKELGH